MSAVNDSGIDVLVATRIEKNEDESEDEEISNELIETSNEITDALEGYINRILERGDGSNVRYGRAINHEDHLKKIHESSPEDEDFEFKGSGLEKGFNILEEKVESEIDSSKSIFIVYASLASDFESDSLVAFIQMQTTKDNVIVEGVGGEDNESVASAYSALDKAFIYPRIDTGNDFYQQSSDDKGNEEDGGEEDNVKFYQERSGDFAKYFLDFLECQTRPSSDSQISAIIDAGDEVKRHSDKEGSSDGLTDREAQKLIELGKENGGKITEGIFVDFIGEIKGEDTNTEEEYESIRKDAKDALAQETDTWDISELHAQAEETNLPDKFKYTIDVESGEITIKCKRNLDDRIETEQTEEGVTVTIKGDKFEKKGKDR